MLPLFIWFPKICFSTIFAIGLNFSLQLTNSGKSVVAESNKPAPIRFTTGTTHSRKRRTPVLQTSSASAPNLLLRCSSIPPLQSTESVFVLKRKSFSIFSLKLKIGGLPKHHNRSSDTNKLIGSFLRSCISSHRENYAKFLSVGSNCGLLTIWYFMYCTVVILSSALCLENKGKQRSGEVLVTVTKMNSISCFLFKGQGHADKVISNADKVISNFCLVKSFSSRPIPKFISGTFAKNCPKLLLKNSRLNPSIARKNKTLCILERLDCDTSFGVIVTHLDSKIVSWTDGSGCLLSNKRGHRHPWAEWNPNRC